MPETEYRCPGESYTITALICRGRQAKGYEKCPSCPHRGRVEAPLETAPAPLPAWRGELEAPAAPARLQVPGKAIAGAAFMLGGSAAAIQARGGLDALRQFARRVYDFF